VSRAVDVALARRDTPGVAHGAHFNSAGAALPPRQVTDAVIAHLERESRLGGYEAAEAARDRLTGTYRSLARLVGCAPDEIALAESATRAWDMAFYGVRLGPGDRVLTSRAEYASNALALLQHTRRTGARLEVVEDDAFGQLCVADLAGRLDAGGVRLVAITHVPTQGGLVNPVERVGALTRAAGVPLLVDACQSVGQLPVDVDTLGADLLSATGRKFLRGPRGTGFLYVRRALLDRLDPPFLDLHAATWTAPDRYELRPDARRFESWERNVAGILGLGVAADYALGWGLDAIEQRIIALAGTLRARLEELPGVRVHDRGERRCGIVTFSVEGIPAPRVKDALTAAGVHTHVSRATSAQYDLPGRGLSEIVRASVHYYNTEAELDRLLHALRAREWRGTP
jgi:cysteine desulfurase / selenocysteine lyase